MHVFLAWFIGANLAAIVFRVMSMLGIGVITYTGTQFLTDQLYQLVSESFTGIPSIAAQTLGYLWFDKAVSLVLSSISAYFTIKTLRSFVGRRQR